MAKTATEEEKLKAYDTLMSLYEKAEPIIHRLADLNTFKYGELPLNPYMLVEAGITLSMVLDALKKMPDSHDKELAIINREFQIALSNCIKAADATEKYVEYSGTPRSRLILNTIVNSTVMANEYMGSVWKRLEVFRGLYKAVTPPLEQPVVVVEKDKYPETVKEAVKEAPTTPRAPRAPIKKKTGGFVSVLDKIADIIIFPIVKMAELSDLIHKSGKKK
jgi:hypothetical protein